MTPMPSQEDPVERFFAAFTRAAEATFVPRRAGARAAFLMELSQKESRRSSSGWRTAGWVFAACAAAAMLWMMSSGAWLERAPPAPVPEVAAVDVPLATPPGVSMPFRVDDDARVLVGPSSQIRLSAGSPGRRRLVLDHGTAVVSGDATEWLVQAGHYEVRVSGTCTLEWRPDVQSLVIELKQGEAELVGNDSVSSNAIRSGGRIELPRDATQTPERTDEPADARKARSRRAGPDRASKRKAIRATEVPPDLALPAEAPATWRTLADRGDFRSAFAEAERLGFSRLCETLPSDALLDLADVARYSGAPHATEKALRALRSRFPGTDVAARAAFDMGRMHAGECEHARRWLETYLSERPAGAMAAAARRRLVECDSSAQVDHAGR